jgi:Rv2258c-like winged HTH domain
VYLGERLGLNRALARHGPATSAEPAGRTGATERYVREWLEHHAAAGCSRSTIRPAHRAPANIPAPIKLSDPAQHR